MDYEVKGTLNHDLCHLTEILTPRLVEIDTRIVMFGYPLEEIQFYQFSKRTVMTNLKNVLNNNFPDIWRDIWELFF